MTEEKQENRQYCDCHGKNMARMNYLEKADMHADVVHERMWADIKDRVPIRYFIALITAFIVLLGGNFTFGMAIYTKLSQVESSVAVVEIQLVDLREHKSRDGR